MRILAVILAVSAVTACGTPQGGYTQVETPISAKCQYEARAAFAGARERSIGDMIDNSIQEGKLARLCMAASAESNPYNPPAVMATGGRPAARIAGGRSTGPWCSDPGITNPALLAECRR